MPTSFNKIGIPYGSAPLNGLGKLVMKVNDADSNYFMASETGNIPGVNNAGAGLYIYRSSNYIGIKLQNTDYYNNIIGVLEIQSDGTITLSSPTQISMYAGNGYIWTNMISNTLFIGNSTNSESMLRITRQGTNDYRLAVFQGGSWVTK